MSFPAVKRTVPATMADLEALPESMKGEIIDGALYAMTRPRAVHQSLAGAVYLNLAPPFHHRQGGPGGWWILPEPGIELSGAPEVSPDLAGWKRDRLPELPRDQSIAIVPDWVCEVLSPGTRRYHYLVKRPLYARSGVSYLWEIDLEARSLMVNHLENGRWVDQGTFGDEEDARIPPFDAMPVSVPTWWNDVPPE